MVQTAESGWARSMIWSAWKTMTFYKMAVGAVSWYTIGGNAWYKTGNQQYTWVHRMRNRLYTGALLRPEGQCKGIWPLSSHRIMLIFSNVFFVLVGTRSGCQTGWSYVIQQESKQKRNLFTEIRCWKGKWIMLDLCRNVLKVSLNYSLGNLLFINVVVVCVGADCMANMFRTIRLANPLQQLQNLNVS